MRDFRGSSAPASLKRVRFWTFKISDIDFRGSSAPASLKLMAPLSSFVRYYNFRGSSAPASLKLPCSVKLAWVQRLFPGQ